MSLLLKKSEDGHTGANAQAGGNGREDGQCRLEDKLPSVAIHLHDT